MAIIPFERSYWVIPNKFIVGEIPASIHETETNQKLNGLIQINTKLVINLMESDEKDNMGNKFHDYSLFLNKNNIETIRKPIKDLSIPTIEKMNEILELIEKYNNLNKIVYLHCWGGVGRTGTVVGCFLIKNGFATKENVFDFQHECQG